MYRKKYQIQQPKPELDNNLKPMANECRINQLHNERLHVQKKTFTKWMNSYLQKARMEVDDIFVDLADGKKLLKLLEIISGEKLGKPNNGKLRVHHIENVNKSLAFLHTKVKLESIGAEDIVDGNKTLILGLLWTIILRFQIQDIEIQLEEETDKKHSAKEALLLWCQRKTKGYRHVNVQDFSQSWRDGMAFNALIHSHRPELIDYDKLDPKQPIENLNNAFTVAQQNLAIQPLLDPEDVDRPKPDEKSVLTYVSSYYHTFAKYNSEVISGKRITNIISQLMEVDRLQLNYELYTTNLLNWIQMKIYQLNNREFPNNLDQIQNEFIKFKEYRTAEKPPKYIERSEIEALLFNIQTKRKALGQTPYVPSDGKLVQDIHKNWIDLEKAEHKRELALREEMLRLEKINNMAESFYRKSAIRKSYLNEMIQVLIDPRYGNNLSQVEATIKKHEAISTDILSRSERIDSLAQMVKELKKENYHDIENCQVIFTEIKDFWDKLIFLLNQHRNNLFLAKTFMRNKQEIETIVIELSEMNKRMALDQNVTHLRAAEEYLQTHSLMEAQISSHGETIKRLTNNANKLLKDESIAKSTLLQPEIPNLKQSLNALNKVNEILKKNAEIKRQKLIRLRDFYKLLQDIEEEESTLNEKMNICQAILPGKDLLSIISLQQKHNVFEAEIQSYEGRIKMLEKRAKPFCEKDCVEKRLIEEKLTILKNTWKQLQEMSNLKSKELSVVIEAFQYHADANEAESWLKEKTQLAKSDDYGTDEQSALSLLQRHAFLESEVMAYAPEIERLDSQSNKMINSDVESLFLLANNPYSIYDIPIDDTSIEENGLHAKQQQETVQQVYEDYEIPQVYVMYNYKEKNYSVSKGEVLILLEKTTNEWWKVQREGSKAAFYVPANYVKEIEPKIGKRLVNKPVEKQANSQNQRTSSKVRRKPSYRRLSIVSPAETVEQRKNNINANYKKLVELCKNRRKLLEDSVKMFAFNRECDSFENWLNEMENSIIKTSSMYKNQQNKKNPSNDLSKQFEKTITDLLANRARLEEIEKMSKEINSTVYLSAAKKRKEQIMKKWDQVNFLQKQLGKNIEGLTTVEEFDAACNETLERINDKLDKINQQTEINQDLKTVQALQRRHENLERELIPIQDLLNKLKIISENVKSSYPLEKSLVDKRLAELNSLWEQLKTSSNEKRNRLDRMIGLQIVKNSSNDIISWLTSYAKPMLQYDPQDASFRNIQSLEAIIKEHEDLLVDIKGKRNDIEDLNQLAQKLQHQVDKNELKIVDEMNNKYQETIDEWNNKTNFLRQCRDLSNFNQEADRIETMINSDLTFLEYADTGKSSHDVLSLIKRHETFFNTLNAQDQRIHNLIDFGDKLIDSNHFDSEAIKERQNRIVQRRKMLKDKAYNRSKVLNDAKIYHEIKSDAEEFLNSCTAKEKSVKDLLGDQESLKNTANLERKIKKHQTLAAEVRANKAQLDKILNDLHNLNKNSHFISPEELNEIDQKVKDKWMNLNNLVEENEKLLRDISLKAEQNKSLGSIKNKVSEIQTALSAEERPIDRRTCRNLLQQHKLNEQELVSLENRLKNLNQKGAENGDALNEDFEDLKSSIVALKEPLNKRKERLLQLDEYHQFEFDVDAELQWIKERITLVSSTDVPQSLTEAQNLLKKTEQNLKREVDGHQSCIEKIIKKADDLVKENHPASKEIEDKSKELKNQWEILLKLISERIEKLKTYLKIHRFLSDCNEIESWLNEKTNILSSPIYGNDEITLVKLLQKQKSIDLEIDTYAGLIDELMRQSEKLSTSIDNEAERKMLKTRAQDLNVRLKKIQKLANERNFKLIDLKQSHEFNRESNDFLEWIAKQKQALLNEDYGKDYEHCAMLQSKFLDLKKLVIVNEERYKQCIENAKRFQRGDDDNRFATNTETINAAWEELINLINAKEQKFIAAMKIHRFSRDVADAFERIREKSTILHNPDYGRDCQSTQNLIRNHEVFENDLVALEAQLQILINDSVKLKSAYPGGNAKQITEKLNSVLEHWENLKNNSSFRRQKLCDTYEYHQIVSLIRNLEQWALNLINQMKIEDHSNDEMTGVDKAQNSKNLHERIKSEIDAREEEFNMIVQEANKLTQSSYYPDIKAQTEKLLKIRDQLHNTWGSINVSLDQLVDFCIFMRDAKQLEQLCQQYKTRLDTFESGNTVEEAEKNQKKFDEFVKLLSSLEQKFKVVEECGQKLIQKNNNHSPKIQEKLDQLREKKTKLWKMMESRKDQLSDDLIYAQFRRDVSEFDVWIAEKRNQIKKESNSIQDKNVDDDIEVKLKKFQKHQSLEAEINANVPRMDDITAKAKHLIMKNHPNSIGIRAQQDDLTNKWNELQALTQEINKGFEEAKDIYEFNKNVSMIENWIREKEMMIQFNDTGVDYEHCESLLRKLDDVGSGLKVDQNEIKKVNDLADKLMQQCQNDQVAEKKIALNEKWRQLQEKIADYRNRLKSDLEIHSLNRDLDEINERITEKHLLASKECDAKNLQSVENAQRKHETLCYDIVALDNHFKNLTENDAHRLMSKSGELSMKPREKIQKIQDNIRKLTQECGNKGHKLKFLKQMHKFFDAMKEYEYYANNMLNNKLSNISTSENTARAKAELEDHEYLKVELIAKRENNQNLKEEGLNLLKELEKDRENNLSHIRKIEECIEKNDQLRKELDQAWENKYNYLKQCEQLHKFNDLSKQCDSWLASKEAFLTNEDLGSNLLTVEELLKKHDSFVESLSAQQKINEFSKFAEELISQDHFDSHNIQIKLNETRERLEKLIDSSKIRKRKLEDSKSYFNFLRNFNEIQRWFAEKLKVANDESYRDSINLLSKKQRHAAFEAEINSNKSRIDDFVSDGERMIAASHFKSDEIRDHLATIERLNRKLNEDTTLKRNRLHDAYQALQFFRHCDSLLMWIKDVDSVLKDQDIGKDLTSVRNLLKKHKLLENDVHNHNKTIENIKDQLLFFEQSNHFQIEEIEDKAKLVIKSFNELQEPLNRRREMLEEYNTFFLFKNDVEHEFFWIKEKENQLNQFDNANTVFDIQRLMKKLKMIESDIQTREPQLTALVSKGHNLLKLESCNLEEIKRLTNELQVKAQYIKDAFALKRVHLANSLESHQFYSDVAEAESWINEKMSFLLNDDSGRDEESLSILLKKLDSMEKEAERFNSTTIGKIMQQSNQLIEKNHNESDTIKQKTESLQKNFENLTESLNKKKATLMERNKYFLFEREADELSLWIKDQLLVANSEDFGHDVEHVENLIQQFNTFISKINSNEERIKSLENGAKDVEGSQEKLEQIKDLWNKLKQRMSSRQEALQGALEVYRFYRSADETICWIREKESSTVLDKVLHDDVNIIKSKIHQLESFESDLNAVKEQVEILYVEADKLSETFPDVKENIVERKNEVQQIWDDLNSRTKSQKENLLQIENSQSYFEKYQELLTWINEMQALVTADDKLEIDVLAAEQQLNRHKDYESEIKAKNDSILNFLETGDKIVSQGHIMSNEIKERNQRIKTLYENLLETWKKRLYLYELNLDARQFVHDVDQIEKWITTHHNYIDDNNFGDSISEVEDLLLKQEEFEKTITAQKDKLDSIERITKIEEYFKNLKREEEEQKEAERSRREKDRIREEEQRRILHLRNNEESQYYENLSTSKLLSSKPSTPKAPRRIASFAFSRKSTKNQPTNENLPPISFEGFLERKHLQQGKKKATSRSWKTYYTLLSGQLLCFFKDKKAFYNNIAASPPFSILNARCKAEENYTKKKNVFSIELIDETKYLFAASDSDKLREWINAIQFRATLPPSEQLIQSINPVIVKTPPLSPNIETSSRSPSSSSSRKSSLSSLPEQPNNNHHSSMILSSSNSQINKTNGTNSNMSSPDIESYDNTNNPPLNSNNNNNKYGSLPPNMEPIKQKGYFSLKEKSSNNFDDNTSLNDDKNKKKRRSLFKRNR